MPRKKEKISKGANTKDVVSKPRTETHSYLNYESALYQDLNTGTHTKRIHCYMANSQLRQNRFNIAVLELLARICWAVSVSFEWGLKQRVDALLLQNIFSPGEDSGDVYEVMGPAGEWRADGRWEGGQTKAGWNNGIGFSSSTITLGCCSFPTAEYFPRADGGAVCSFASEWLRNNSRTKTACKNFLMTFKQ